jgi:hypothetical protein
MTISRKQEERALSLDEREVVEKSHHPAIQSLSDVELSRLVKLMRERRDRARAMAERRRRELRGKAAARGATPARDDEGSKLKLSVLSMAMRRFNAEIERRRRMNARLALVASANRALAAKQRADRDVETFNTRHAHQGLRPKEDRRARSLIRPGERGRLRKAAAVAQAKKDSRGQ